MQNSQVYLIIIMQLYFSSHEPFSHEPLAHRLAYSILMVCCLSSVRPSVVHNAQTSSPKPLDQSKANFMWSLLE